MPPSIEQRAANALDAHLGIHQRCQGRRRRQDVRFVSTAPPTDRQQAISPAGGDTLDRPLEFDPTAILTAPTGVSKARNLSLRQTWMSQHLNAGLGYIRGKVSRGDAGYFHLVSGSRQGLLFLVQGDKHAVGAILNEEQVVKRVVEGHYRAQMNRVTT